MKIMMIRHFQTPGNLKKQYLGRTDEPLLEGDGPKGCAAKTRARFRQLGRPQYVVASPMKRCIQTAVHLFPEKEPIICEQMRECDFGIFEGKNYEELKDLPAYQKWMDSWGKLPFPGGESHDAFKERCQEGFDRMAGKLISKECSLAAMVVHGGTIMAVLSKFDREKRAFYSWQAENGGGYLISLDEGNWKQGKKVFGEIEQL